MCEFYEQWSLIFSIRPLSMGELSTDISATNRHPATDDFSMNKLLEHGIDLGLLVYHLDGFICPILHL